MAKQKQPNWPWQWQGNWLATIGNLESRLLHCLVHLQLFSHGIFHAALYKCVQIEIKRQFQSQTGRGKTKLVRLRCVCVCVCASINSRQRHTDFCKPRRNLVQSAARASAEQTSIATHAHSHGRPTTVASTISSVVWARSSSRAKLIKSANCVCLNVKRLCKRLEKQQTTTQKTTTTQKQQQQTNNIGNDKRYFLYFFHRFVGSSEIAFAFLSHNTNISLTSGPGINDL